MNQTAANKDKFRFFCSHCDKEFFPPKPSCTKTRILKYGLKVYCCKDCKILANGGKPSKVVNCAQCGKEISTSGKNDKRKKSDRCFCSSSCAATYNNLHKTHGTRRSKLEAWLEETLPSLYPSLEILYNDKTAINSELDIYIPSLRLAFELNGIYHYEPIHGKNKLESIQKNDANKFALCHENNISLCIIDTSKQTYFSTKNSQKYLDIICNIINENIGLTNHQA